MQRGLPRISFGFSDGPEDVSERVRNDAPQLGYHANTLHGERLACPRLAIRKYRSCSGMYLCVYINIYIYI